MAKAKPAEIDALPTATIPSDDCVITFGKRKYRPHAGQHIKVAALGTIGDVELTMDLASMGSLGDLTPEQATDVAAKIAAIRHRLSESIIEWDWTDVRGNVLPSPPTPDVIKRLTIEEVNYLVRKVVTGAAAEDTERDRKNAESPSTSR